ncbi:hypothetical protein FBU30_008126 [Linnemannia zychae]|nr:hypothetical protein FBU30_008126 [Linnemannia zychae]
MKITSFSFLALILYTTIALISAAPLAADNQALERRQAPSPTPTSRCHGPIHEKRGLNCPGEVNAMELDKRQALATPTATSRCRGPIHDKRGLNCPGEAEAIEMDKRQAPTPSPTSRCHGPIHDKRMMCPGDSS